MRHTLRTSAVLLFGVVLAASVSAVAQRGAKPAAATGNPADATARIVAAAQALLTTLDEAGRAKVQFPFEGEQKTRWSNLPTGIFKREGLRMGDLTPPQRAAVTTLLQASLSTDGYRKVTEIILGDEVLRTGAGTPRGGGAPVVHRAVVHRAVEAHRAAVVHQALEGHRRVVHRLVAHRALVARLARVAVAAVVAVEGRTSARPSTTSRSSARRRRRPRGCCSSAAITSRST